jgi:uncharacterized protein YjbI with pentapeptide repeats
VSHPPRCDLLLANPVQLSPFALFLPLRVFFAVAPLGVLLVHLLVMYGFRSKGAQWATEPGLLPQTIFAVLMFILPVGLLLYLQIVFLPFHHEYIIRLQRLVLLIDIAIVWILWPVRPSFDRDAFAGAKLETAKALALAGAAAFSLFVVVFPGEFMETLPSLRIIPGGLIRGDSPSPRREWISLHQLLFSGGWDNVRQELGSIWSDVIVAPDVRLSDVKNQQPERVSFRGRDLVGAILARAQLPGTDFSAADLSYAQLTDANLKGARFECVVTLDKPHAITCSRLNGAWIVNANLDGALMRGVQLRGASLDAAKLRGADLHTARLDGASLLGSQLQGAVLRSTSFSFARLDYANLMVSDVNGADFNGASLKDTQFQGALNNGFDIDLSSAVLDDISVWRMTPPTEGVGGYVTENAWVRKIRWDQVYRGGLGKCNAAYCILDKETVQQIRSTLSDTLRDDSRLPSILKRIDALDPDNVWEKLSDDWRRDGWKDVENASNVLNGRGSDVQHQYELALRDKIVERVCLDDDPPFLLEGLLRDTDDLRLETGETRQRQDRFRSMRFETANLAKAILGHSSCNGIRGLSREDNEKLRQLANGER